MATDTSIEEQILRRLNLLILLQLEKVKPESGTTTASKIHWLRGLGLQPAEVASIVGKPINYVTAVNSSSRQAAKKKEKRGG